jgi:hypothetical protein
MNLYEGAGRFGELSGVNYRDSTYWLDGDFLVHLFFTDVFDKFALPANDQQDKAILASISELCEETFQSEDELLVDGLGVSFLELAYRLRPRTDPLLLALGPKCWTLIATEHEDLAQRAHGKIRPLVSRM